jgi:hypothetical protein
MIFDTIGVMLFVISVPRIEISGNEIIIVAASVKKAEPRSRKNVGIIIFFIIKIPPKRFVPTFSRGFSAAKYNRQYS